MRIGLYDIDKVNHANYAFMKISAYHKAKSDTVAWYSPIERPLFDKVYVSSIFNYSDRDYMTDDMICGGVGFDIDSKLPEGIEKCEPDYSIYPECDYSLIWFDIGCFRNCPFCINNNNHRTVNRLTLNPYGKYIKVQDDTFFYGDWKHKVEWLQQAEQSVEIQNIDARLLTEEMAEAILTLKHYRRMKMAWDNPRDNIDWEQIKKWIPKWRIMVYILIGYWSTPEEDLHRVMTLKKLDISPFVMPYNKFDEYQKKFARWVNMKAIFKNVMWEDYERA